MSGICGWVGVESAAGDLEAMLERIDYRGDRQEQWLEQQVALGYRWWGGRPGKAQGIWHGESEHLVCCGTLAPVVDSPPQVLRQALVSQQLDELDGAFAAAYWDGRRLTLIRDPFGVRSLYYWEVAGGLYFASEIKQLLALSQLEADLDFAAIHRYLTFSFVPGEQVPIRGVRRVPPGHLLTWEGGVSQIRPYFTLEERPNPRLQDQASAVRFVRRRCHRALRNRLSGESPVGLYLSGGLDSSALALWLSQLQQPVEAFSLDFGEHAEARQVADLLKIPLTLVKVDGESIEQIFWDLVWRLDMPFGDPVTGPQYLLGQAARARGLEVVFNGEGGDQLFGGWTAKPMVAGAVYADLVHGETLEEMYLRSYHRFYGLEPQLYSQDLLDQVGPPGQRRALLAPYLGTDLAQAFLHRVRLADIWLKGALNILPRAERLTNGWGLDLRVPLFDRKLAETSFALPPALKLKGATEKFVLKCILQQSLPDDIVWRRKSGMSVPITDWCLGPLQPLLRSLLGPESILRRGLFQPAYLERLLQGQDQPGEIRRRRVGERLWALAMLEGWLRVFKDGRGRKP